MENGESQGQQPNYVHLYPFRFVQPYPHVYRTFAKGRWIGKELLATLIKEFKAYPPEYYENAILTGQITVNNNKAECDYTLKNGDQILHSSLRVEPPVLDLPIEIISQSQDFLIINKPPSINVHTGGGHHYNTIENLLRYENGFKKIHILHRLDKCTSGLLILAKQKESVALFHKESESQIMKKMYFARVSGRVEWEERTLSAYIQCISHKDGVYKVIAEIFQQAQIQKKSEEVGQKHEVNNENEGMGSKAKDKDEQDQKHLSYAQEKQNPILKWQKKNQQSVNSDIKSSKTIFKKVWYDEVTDSSLLQCYPVTGRTHQIRVHLQYLGHPILNDVGYTGRFVGNGIIKYIQGKYAQKEEQSMGLPCKRLKPSEQFSVEDWDYHNKPWEIMLHSYHYKFGGHSFTTKLPYWFHKDAIAKYVPNIQQK